MPQSTQRTSSATGAAGAAALERQKKKNRGVALTKRRSKRGSGKPAKTKRRVTLASKLHRQMNAQLAANTEMQMIERAVRIDGRRLRVLKAPTSKDRKANSEAIKATKRGTVVRENRGGAAGEATRTPSAVERQEDRRVEEIIEELGVGSDDDDDEQEIVDEKARKALERKQEETRHLNDVLFTQSVFD
jgi:hypothetical protein